MFRRVVEGCQAEAISSRSRCLRPTGCCAALALLPGGEVVGTLLPSAQPATAALETLQGGFAALWHVCQRRIDD